MFCFSDAITSSSHLATYALKPLTEKLEATSANVKVDVFDMLISGAEKFDPKALNDRLDEIVKLTREEVNFPVVR